MDVFLLISCWAENKIKLVLRRSETHLSLTLVSQWEMWGLESRGLFVFLLVKIFHAQKSSEEGFGVVWLQKAGPQFYRPLFNCCSVYPVNCTERDIVLAFFHLRKSTWTETSNAYKNEHGTRDVQNYIRLSMRVYGCSCCLTTKTVCC